jgi:hypothetical protein
MKKLILLFALLVISHSIVFSQGCLPEGITFTTQEEIDNFQLNYPGCTEIEGLVYISGFDITNLNGLNVLTSIGQSLRIQYTVDLENLEGLNNLIHIGIDLEIRNNYALTSTAGLEGLTYIPEDLWIEANPVLNDLSGLSNISSIGYSLIIDHNPLLLEVDDFYNLTSIKQLLIYWNDQITNLNGLINVNSEINSINISDNQNLSDISGIQHFQPEDDLSLTIFENPILFQCDIQSICEYLTAPNGTIEIHDNAPGCNSPEEIQDACASLPQPCLPEGITFTTQEEIDNFQTNYPECTEIEGDVVIEGNSISNLNGLSVLTSISGALTISQNPSLSSLSGLENVTFTGELVIIRNELLSNFIGLDGLTTISGTLIIGYDMPEQGNTSLINLTGLEGLHSIGGNLGIFWNDELSSLNGLDNLTEIGGFLEIIDNPISSLTGLGNLTNIGNYLLLKENSELISLAGATDLQTLGSGLHVIDNDQLMSLIDLVNIDPNSITDLVIYNNNSLFDCDAQNICEYLVSPGGIVEIHDNAPGCNSQAEVEEACLNSIVEIVGKEEINISPNPASTFITINIKEGIAIELAIVYNHLGQKVLETKPVNNTVDVSKLKPGIYFIELVTKDWSEMTKVVKQ